MSDEAKRRIEAIGSQLGLFAEQAIGPKLAGRVAIITGANSTLGIGVAAARQFAQHGARAIYMCDVNGDRLAFNKREMQASWPVDVHMRTIDAADEAAIRAVVADALQQYGRLDVFFANAGVTGPQVAFAEIEAADFMETMRVNALSVFLAVKHAAPAMGRTSVQKMQASGSIIATSSVAALRSNAGATPYSASKAAVVSMAQTMAFQLAGSGVRVNALCPGLIETGMTAPIFDAARAKRSQGRIGQLNPLGRAGKADEVGRLALFLASDDSSYVNGQAWAIDGGLSAGHPFVPGKMA